MLKLPPIEMLLLVSPPCAAVPLHLPQIRSSTRARASFRGLWGVVACGASQRLGRVGSLKAQAERQEEMARLTGMLQELREMMMEAVSDCSEEDILADEDVKVLEEAKKRAQEGTRLQGEHGNRYCAACRLMFALKYSNY